VQAGPRTTPDSTGVQDYSKSNSKRPEKYSAKIGSRFENFILSLFAD
jgi:hypothetical protein